MQTFLAIAIRTQKGDPKNAKVKGSVKAGVESTKKTLHIGEFERVEELTKKEQEARRKGVAVFPKVFYREHVCHAEFDGPTCEDAARSFLEMFKKCTRANGIRCKADGKGAPVKLWRKVDFVTAIES